MRDQITTRILTRLQDYAAEIGTTFTEDMIALPAPPDPAMGDYAINLPLRLAKIAKQPPIKIAERIAGILALETEWFSSVSVAPPGYVNLTIANNALERALTDTGINLEDTLRREGEPQRVVVDYSGVNIAKQMHVGHLRSIIIGDVIARVLEARGETVIRQSHLGDWGLPIAMVIWAAQPVIREVESRGGDLSQELTLARLEAFYREATEASKTDPDASKAIHEILVKLQNGDEELLTDWQKITRLSMGEVYRVYEQMGVSLHEDSECGESFYRNRLEETVAVINSCGLLQESEGALCVFLDQFKRKDGQPLPVLVKKSDGGYNYATFDLAAIRYRIEELKADRVIYVVDSRQSLHFSQIFAVADSCGWTKRDDHKIALEHVAFGSVKGEDGKPLKTRSGENVKLAGLLQEAVERALAVVNEKNPSLAEDYKREVARAVGIGAVKYADLSHDRINDYVFAWDRMLALNGNTGPYLQYAHARICSIFRKGGIDEESVVGPVIVEHPTERALAFKLLEFPEALAAVEEELKPHTLCTMLYELATAFSGFYDQCSVLNAETEALKISRLLLCRMVQQTMAKGLNLLGIESPREM